MTTHNATPGAVAHAEGQDNGQAHETLTPFSIPQPAVIDYAFLKATAKALGVSVESMTALSCKNDPFYVGTKGDLIKSDWFREAWERGGFTQAHLRRIHYQIASLPNATRWDGKPYENTEPDWDKLCDASKAARYLDLVPTEKVIDAKSPPPKRFAKYDGEPSFWIDVPVLARPYYTVTGFNPEFAQRYHLEVWVEKSTMNDVLEPVCRRYHANLVTSEGEFGIYPVLDATHRVAEAAIAAQGRIERTGKPARIFLITDFDPAGKSIPKAVARKLEFFAQGTNLDIKVCQLGLTAEQVKHYRLPRIPLKATEKRRSRFEALYGEGAVELDALEALHPGVLAGIVEGALSPFYSRKAAQDAINQEHKLSRAVHEKLQAIAEKYQEQIEAVADYCAELEAVGDEIDMKEFQIEAAPESPEADAAFNWLLDTRRDYFTQLAAYRAFEQGRPS